MSRSYFHKVHNETLTRFRVNNPTPKEASLAILAGAEYCTTNPTYAIKMLNHNEMQSEGLKIVKEVITEEQDDSLAASKIQALPAKKNIDIFHQIYTHSSGTKGWVSIQGDPEKEEDYREIL